MGRVLILGASGAIGGALADAARARGDEVVGLSRRDHGLDLTDEASIAAALAGVQGKVQRIIVATGALTIDGMGPEKALRGLDPAALARQFAVNAMGPVLALKQALRLMPRDQPCQFAALSARVGSIGDNGLGGWYSYRAAKAALNQLIHTAAIEVARTHPQSCVVLLHPGTVETPLTEGYRGTHPAVPPAVAAQNLLAVLDRLTPAETGGFFDQSGKVIPW